MTNEMVSFLAGFMSGVVTNWIAWWFLYHRVVPRITFSDSLSRTPLEKSREDKCGYRYKFKIQKDKLGNVIDQIRSMPGVVIQTKTDVKKGEGPKEKEKQIQPSFPEVK